MLLQDLELSKSLPIFAAENGAKRLFARVTQIIHYDERNARHASGYFGTFVRGGGYYFSLTI